MLKKRDSQDIISFLGKRVVAQKNLIPDESNPFYIVTPPFTRISAGVRVLHALCHYLNIIGEKAFIVVYPLELDSDPQWPYFARFSTKPLQNYSLNTPILSKEIVDEHFSKGLTPICVYPEVFDDPLSAPFIARYILNYPGLLAPKYTVDHDLTVSYSERLAEHVGDSLVMHMPTIDMNFFYRKKAIRRGACYYAGKYRDIYKGDLSILPEGCIEIQRSEKMSREEVREIFWSTQLFYCFEDTALAIEACLCGCAVVFIPNEHFSDGPISSSELGWDGMAWGNDDAEIQRALSTVSNVKDRLTKLYEQMPVCIAEFAERAKISVKNVPYRDPIKLPYDMRRIFVSRNILSTGMSIDEQKEDDSAIFCAENRATRFSGYEVPSDSVFRLSVSKMIGVLTDIGVKVTTKSFRWHLLNLFPRRVSMKLMHIREAHVQRQRTSNEPRR